MHSCSHGDTWRHSYFNLSLPSSSSGYPRKSNLSTPLFLHITPNLPPLLPPPHVQGRIGKGMIETVDTINTATSENKITRRISLHLKRYKSSPSGGRGSLLEDHRDASSIQLLPVIGGKIETILVDFFNYIFQSCSPFCRKKQLPPTLSFPFSSSFVSFLYRFLVLSSCINYTV